MEQSESAYEQQRRETISMNERKLAELGLASAPLAPRPAKASRGLPRPPPGERTRVQPRRASTDEGTRPDYGESPPPAARRRLAGSAANGHAAPAAEESRDEEPSAAELTEAASAADELRTGSAPFVLRRAPSGAVVRASVPLKPLGSAARVCCSSAPAVRDSHACLPRARPQATVFIAGAARRPSRWPGSRTAGGCASSWPTRPTRSTRRLRQAWRASGAATRLCRRALPLSLSVPPSTGWLCTWMPAQCTSCATSSGTSPRTACGLWHGACSRPFPAASPPGGARLHGGGQWTPREAARRSLESFSHPPVCFACSRSSFVVDLIPTRRGEQSREVRGPCTAPCCVLARASGSGRDSDALATQHSARHAAAAAFCVPSRSVTVGLSCTSGRERGPIGKKAIVATQTR